ncbi:Nipped-B-like protein B [Merluccius polli]|uniref:Nipped-B-like protein B n=1 Tax=Merluccius polli TaxID=89951 RepID=A0AA47N612_MERPO|nr:Nipped-B-like protein B [Merluccius polli]
MPQLPITTLAGISSLTDFLNHLPLPSPLPATTARSFLYSSSVAADVFHLLASRDEKLASRLAPGLSQVSTENIEPTHSVEDDGPEGEVPVLLQTVLSSHPAVFLGNRTGQRRAEEDPSTALGKEVKTYKRKHGGAAGVEPGVTEANSDQDDPDPGREGETLMRVSAPEAVQKKCKRPQEKDVLQEERQGTCADTLEIRHLGEHQQRDGVRGESRQEAEDPQEGSPMPTALKSNII